MSKPTPPGQYDLSRKREERFRDAKQLLRKLRPTAKRLEVVMNLFRPFRYVECPTCGGEGKLHLPQEPLINREQALQLLDECWPPREGETS